MVFGLIYIFQYFEMYYQKSIVVFFGIEGRREGGGVMEVFIMNVLLGGDWVISNFVLRLYL